MLSISSLSSAVVSPLAFLSPVVRAQSLVDGGDRLRWAVRHAAGGRGAADYRVPVIVVAGRERPRYRGEGGYHTTMSGRTRVYHPGAYGYRTLYHCSTRRVEVGARWLLDRAATLVQRELRAVRRERDAWMRSQARLRRGEIDATIVRKLAALGLDEARLRGLRVTVADAVAAGCCARGTAAWVRAHAGGRDSLTATALLRVLRSTGDQVSMALQALQAACERAGLPNNERTVAA